MENADSRFEAHRLWVCDQISGLVFRVNQSLERIGRDMREAYSRIDWLENEVKALRRTIEHVKQAS